MPESGKRAPLDNQALQLHHKIDRLYLPIEIVEKRVRHELEQSLGECKSCPNAVVRTEETYFAHADEKFVRGMATCKTRHCSRVEVTMPEFLSASHSTDDFRRRILKEATDKAAVLGETSLRGKSATMMIIDDVTDHPVDAMRYAMTPLKDSSKDRPTSAAAGSW